MTPRPWIVDLFCKAGGAGKGYHLAGFDVIGVDMEPQPNYPFEFVRADALAVLDAMWFTQGTVGDGAPIFRGERIAAVHASPPCQDYSVTRSLHTAEYPRLIGPVRERLQAIGVPYVIENVEGARADMVNPVRLCGSSFGLGVRRHRLFETSWPVGFVPPCAHYLQPEPVDVTGTGGSRQGDRLDGGGGNSRKPLNLAHAREVMGMGWATRRELAEAVPPAFTEWVGAELLDHLSQRAA